MVFNFFFYFSKSNKRKPIKTWLRGLVMRLENVENRFTWHEEEISCDRSRQAAEIMRSIKKSEAEMVLYTTENAYVTAICNYFTRLSVQLDDFNRRNKLRCVFFTEWCLGWVNERRKKNFYCPTVSVLRRIGECTHLN